MAKTSVCNLPRANKITCVETHLVKPAEFCNLEASKSTCEIRHRRAALELSTSMPIYHKGYEPRFFISLTRTQSNNYKMSEKSIKGLEFC